MLKISNAFVTHTEFIFNKLYTFLHKRYQKYHSYIKNESFKKLIISFSRANQPIKTLIFQKKAIKQKNKKKNNRHVQFMKNLFVHSQLFGNNNYWLFMAKLKLKIETAQFYL